MVTDTIELGISLLRGGNTEVQKVQYTYITVVLLYLLSCNFVTIELASCLYFYAFQSVIIMEKKASRSVTVLKSLNS